MLNHIGNADIKQPIIAMATDIKVFLSSAGPIEKPGEPMWIETEITIETYEWQKQDFSIVPADKFVNGHPEPFMAHVRGSVCIKARYDPDTEELSSIEAYPYPNPDDYIILNKKQLKNEIVDIMKKHLETVMT